MSEIDHRSFKMSCPPPRREVRSRPRHDDSIGATSDVGPSLNASPVSGLEHSRTGFPTMTSERIDSTYGTDSNRTVSPQDAKSEPGTILLICALMTLGSFTVSVLVTLPVHP